MKPIAFYLVTVGIAFTLRSRDGVIRGAMADGNSKKGKRLYGQYCTQCHGRIGGGGGD